MQRLLFLWTTLFSVGCYAQTAQDELMGVLDDELQREVKGFATAAQPPYYIGYRVTDGHELTITATFGSLMHSAPTHRRSFLADVKVGTYSLDNTHQSEDDSENFGHGSYDGPGGGGALPNDNKPELLKLLVWEQTQNAYREALEQYKQIKSRQVDNTKTNTADFSKEEPASFTDAPLPDLKSFINQHDWEERLRKVTAVFLQEADIIDATASLSVSLERKYLVSSEGTRIAENRISCFLYLSSSIRAKDGDIVPLHNSYFAYTSDKLPSADVLLADANTMIAKLKALREAPLAEPYTGPAILSAAAAGVFFHEIFGHRIEGHRLKDKADGQTFKGKLNEQVLLKTLNVICDPTVSEYKGQALNGFYHYDDEGVKGQRVTIVEDGILRNFLLSRSPLLNFTNSNGHGRAQDGFNPVSRQSNLIIENKKEMPMSELRKMLITECKKQKLPYGYLFANVTGGFTTTDRFQPNAFNIFPIEVYRVYANGRPDELVRGVDLIGTPLAMFAEIKAADNKPEVFTGFCGAESGSVPVTTISPALFVKRIETQKKSNQHTDSPLLPKPVSK